MALIPAELITQLRGLAECLEATDGRIDILGRQIDGLAAAVETLIAALDRSHRG